MIRRRHVRQHACLRGFNIGELPAAPARRVERGGFSREHAEVPGASAYWIVRLAAVDASCPETLSRILTTRR